MADISEMWLDYLSAIQVCFGVYTMLYYLFLTFSISGLAGAGFFYFQCSLSSLLVLGGNLTILIKAFSEFEQGVEEIPTVILDLKRKFLDTEMLNKSG